MTQVIAYLEAVVGADITSFRRGMQEVRRETGLLSDTLGGVAGVGRSLTYALSVPMLAAGMAAVSTAVEFDTALRNINSIAQLSEQELSKLSNEVLRFGSTTRSGANEAAKALYEVYSAGLSGDEAMALMKQSVLLAESGLSDLTRTTNALTATMLVYGDTGLTVADASNIWARMVQLGVGSLEDFMTNAQKVLPISHTMGISFQELGGSLAFLSQIGGGAKKGETALSMMLSNLLKPTETLKKAYQELGIETGIDLIKHFGGLQAALVGLEGEMTRADFISSVFSKTGLEAALAMTGNYEKLLETMTQFNEGLDTATMSAHEQQMMSFSAQWDLMKSAIEGAAIAIGQLLMPTLTPFIEMIRDAALAFLDLDPGLQKVIVGFGVAAVVLPPLLWLFGAILNPVTLLIAAIATLGGYFVTNFDAIKNSASGIGALIIKPLSDFKDIAEDFVKDLTTGDTFETEVMGRLGGGMKPIQIDIPIEAGATLYDIYYGSEWSTQLQSSMGYDEFVKKALSDLEISDPRFLRAGDTLSFTIPVSAGAEFDVETTKITSGGSFIDRLSVAIRNAAPRVQTALGDMWDTSKTWFETVAVPTFDTVSGAVMDAIAGIFVVSNEGAEGTPAYQSIRTFVENLVNGIPGTISDVVSSFPSIGDSIQPLLDSIGTWIQQDGIPTLARTIGLAFGTLIQAIVAGIVVAVSWWVNWLVSGQFMTDLGNIAMGITRTLVNFIVGILDSLPSTVTSAMENIIQMIVEGVDDLARELNIKILEIQLFLFNKLAELQTTLLNAGIDIEVRPNLRSDITSLEEQIAGKRLADELSENISALVNSAGGLTLDSPITLTSGGYDMSGTVASFLDNQAIMGQMSDADMGAIRRSLQEQLYELMTEAFASGDLVGSDAAQQLNALVPIATELGIDVDDIWKQFEEATASATEANIAETTITAAVTVNAGSIDTSGLMIAVQNKITETLSGISTTPGTSEVSGKPHASGGTAEGWSTVGERGAELVYFGDRGTVFPQHMLRTMANNNNAGQGSGNSINVYGIQDVDSFLYEMKRRGIMVA